MFKNFTIEMYGKVRKKVGLGGGGVEREKDKVGETGNGRLVW